MDDDAEKHLKTRLIPLWFWLLALVIVGVWFLGPRIVAWQGGKAPPTSAGEFGDQFGAINTLFSGLAFLGILVSILIQGKEFRSQLREMAVNAKEMQEQSKIYTEQLSLLRMQNGLLSQQLIETQVQERLAAQPFLIFKFSMSTKQLHFWIQNHGSPVYGFEVVAGEAPAAPIWTVAALSKEMPEIGGQIAFENASASPEINIFFRYVTRLGHSMEESFVMKPVYSVDSMKGHSDMAKIGHEIRLQVHNLHA